MIGVIICTYNRPEYLRECLASIDRARKPNDTKIVIIDDCSTNPETIEILANSGHFVIYKPIRRGIKHSLLMGFDQFFDKGFDVVMNFDSDAVISNDCIEEAVRLKESYPSNIVSCFHSTTKNANGSDRHPIVAEGEDCFLKRSVGGINFVLDKGLYERYVKPVLKTDKGNWDAMACGLSLDDNRAIVTPKESKIEHIGHISSMGHTTHELPDTGDGFKKVFLPNVTLIGADCVDFDKFKFAADECEKDIRFGAVKLLTHFEVDDPRAIKIPQLKSKGEYSKFILKELSRYVETDYLLIFQSDGFVKNAEAWNDEWFNYDVIGAPWMFRDHNMVGNGGFSLRSKRLHDILTSDESIVPSNDHLIKNFEEDHNIGYIYRAYLERVYDIRFAPVVLASRFSIEAYGQKYPNNVYDGQFGFHGKSCVTKDKKHLCQ